MKANFQLIKKPVTLGNGSFQRHEPLWPDLQPGDHLCKLF